MRDLDGFSFFEMFLLMAPFVVFTLLAMLGIDKRLARGRNPRTSHRPKFCELSPDGRWRLPDPDGVLDAREISTGCQDGTAAKAGRQVA